MDTAAAETESHACTDSPDDERDAAASRRTSRLLTACLVADLVLTLVLLGDIAVTWHRHHRAPAAPACGPGSGR